MDKDSPENWGMAPLGSLIEFSLGGDWGKGPDFQDENYVEVRCIRSSEVKNWNTEKGLSAAKRKIKKSSLEKRRLREGDIIVEVSGGGPDQPVGRTVLIDNAALSNDPETPKICTNFFRLIRPVEGIYPKYLDFFLKFFYKTGKVKDFQGGSNNLRNLKFKDYLGLEVPVPPKGEQHHIVGKIEELFSELDDSVANLETARARLQAYRQSLLKHAFEGRLTEQWRRDHADELESADQLLECIREERQARYQQQLEDWKAQVAQWEADGKPGKKPRKPAAPKELPPLTEEEIEDLPELPEGWRWERYGNTCSLVRNGIPKAPHGSEGDRILRISAVRPSRIDLSDFRKIPNSDGEYDEFLLRDGDVLFTRYNGSRAFVGVAATFRGQGRYLYPDKLIRTQLFTSHIFPEFMEMAANSGGSRSFIESRIRTTAGQSGISGTDIKNMPIPICSFAEQEKLVGVLQARLSQVDHMERTVEGVLKQTESLRQSILKRAFEGRLVPQGRNQGPLSDVQAGDLPPFLGPLPT